MEDDLKYCRNKRCRRNQVTIYAPGRKYCIECGAKLKKGWGHTDHDTPPLIDDAPSQQELWRATNASTKPKRNEGNLVTIPTASPDQSSLQMVDWQKFRGTYKEWEEYKAEFESGKFEKWNPDGTEKSKGSEDWSCADAEIEGCPLTGSKTKIPRVKFTWAMYQRWIALCKAFDTEWIAYLKGTKDNDGVFTITEMYFPKQKATGAHVTADDQENQIQPDTIGTVHSHVGMGAFFSGEDKKHMNHDVEMVVNRRGEMAVAIRTKLECGRNSRIECPALITSIPGVNSEEDIAALKSVISEEKHQWTGPRSQGFGYN